MNKVDIVVNEAKKLLKELKERKKDGKSGRRP